MIATIDPNTFQSQVLAWIGVLTVVAGALSGFIALIISYYNKLRAQAAADKATVANQRLDHQSSKIDMLRSDITSVALATSPSNGAPQPVEVVNAPTQPVPTKETKPKP